MSFILIAACCISATAVALTSFFIPLINLIFRRKKSFARFTIAAVFLSISIACVTVILIFIPDPVNKLKSLLEIHNIIYFLSLTVVVCAMTIWYKSVLPIFAILYVVYCVSITIFLFYTFGNPHEILEIKIEEPLPTINAGSYVVQVESITLSDKLLLPIPKVWYKIINTNADLILEESQENSLQTFITLSSKKIFCKPFNNLLKLTATGNIYSIRVPDSGVYPMLYSLQLSSKGNAFYYKLNRLF